MANFVHLVPAHRFDAAACRLVVALALRSGVPLVPAARGHITVVRGTVVVAVSFFAARLLRHIVVEA